MVVLDASIVYKWLVPEKPKELTVLARKIRDKFWKGEEETIVPDILLYELANAFAFKTKLPKKDVRDAWEQLEAYNLLIFTPNLNFIAKTIDFSRKYKVSVYDASYAVLAREKECDFFTADEKFVKQVNLPFVKALSGYLKV